MSSYLYLKVTFYWQSSEKIMCFIRVKLDFSFCFVYNVHHMVYEYNMKYSTSKAKII
jgi:hypothetical protein